MRDFEEFETSSIKSLRVNTFARNLKRTRRKTELQDNLDQKYLRRDLLNVVNSTSFLSYLNSNFFLSRNANFENLNREDSRQRTRSAIRS